MPQLSSLLYTLGQRLPIRIAIWHLEDAADPGSVRLLMVNYSSSALHSKIICKPRSAGGIITRSSLQRGIAYATEQG
jgi:hypothetical protein